MKVWILTGQISYEGEQLIGVFSTPEKANNAKEECQEKERSVFEDYDIEETNLNEFKAR